MIALPSSARSGEQPSTTTIQEPYIRPSTTRSFHSPPPQQNERASTPSVSPLSTTSQGQLDHKIGNADNLHQMRNGAGQHNASNNYTAHTDEDRSSSLSDFEGSLADMERREGDRSSQAMDDEEVEDDSEAETERIGRTPQKLANAAMTNGDTARTPSKLYQESTYDEELSDADSTPTGPGRQSVSPLGAQDSGAQDLDTSSRKRKRTSPLSERDSPLSDESDSDRALAKRRNHTRHSSEHKVKSESRGRRENVPPVQEDEEEERDEIMEDTHGRPTIEVEDVEAESMLSSTKMGKRKKGKSKGRAQKPPLLEHDETVEKDVPSGQEMDDPPEENEDEDDSVEAISAEELEKREHASKAFGAIAQQFIVFRNKHLTERLASVEADLAQLHQPAPVHHEYIAMLQSITARRDLKISREMRLHEYKKTTLRTQTVANRSQLLSQYFQDARETRDEILYGLGKQWYDIQKERRSSHTDQVDDYLYKFPTKRSDQVRQQAKYNMEVSILSGVAKHVGFPAAPGIDGARDQELDDDLKAMKITVPHPVSHTAFGRQSMPHVAPRQATSEHLAQKEFLEQTPWANPQHPIHHYNSATQPSNTPLLNMLRQSSAPGHRTSSPFTTPIIGSHRRNDHDTNGIGSSDTIGLPSDPPSSVIACPPTMDRDRIQLISVDQLGDGSPIGAAKRVPGSRTETKRDFSGLSSASTVEVPSDPATAPEMDISQVLTRPASLPMESSAPHQAFATSALHAQHGDARKPEVYTTADHWSRMGAFGTPMPLGAGSMASAPTAQSEG